MNKVEEEIIWKIILVSSVKVGNSYTFLFFGLTQQSFIIHAMKDGVYMKSLFPFYMNFYYVLCY